MLVDSKYIELSVVKQCELLEINRSSFYYEPVAESEENLSLMRVLDEQYFKTPFYGLERLLVLFILKGYKITLLSDKSIKIEPYYLKYGPKHIGLVTTTKPYEQ
jgi:hypothetical protein